VKFYSLGRFFPPQAGIFPQYPLDKVKKNELNYILNSRFCPVEPGIISGEFSQQPMRRSVGG
jgi:hypothetical protein